MTTQVALINGLGVAVASDSAVTSGNKVLKNSEKIFDLPSPHKAAVLVSGNAEFMEHPWEVVLSAWSETLDGPLESMNLYRESLYRFLRTILPNSSSLSEAERRYLMRGSYAGTGNTLEQTKEALYKVLVPSFETLLNQEDFANFKLANWDEEFRTRMSAFVTAEMVDELNREFERIIQDRMEIYTNVDNISYSQALVWVENYWEAFQDFDAGPTKYDLEDWPIIPGLDNLINKMHSIFLVHPNYLEYSNINFIGYGARDLFPSASGVYIEGAIAGNLLKRHEGEILPSGKPVPLFFGQTDALDSLLRGDDSLLINAAVDNTRRTLTEINDRLAELGDEQAGLAREYIKQSIEQPDIESELKRIGSEQRQEPFNKAISMAPIIDLAEFASQLVGIQSATAALSQDNPTVGGFVDVAIVTHRQGFEWIRHKK